MRMIKRQMKQLLKQLKYGGSQRKCSVCKKSAKRFLKFGIVPRVDARCPFCNALERHRFFWWLIENKTKFLTEPPEKVLHIAPHSIVEAKLRPLIGDGYLTGDLLNPTADMKVDVTDMPFPNDSYDFVLCSHVLEHVPDDRKAMREFHRILKPNGIAILIVPIYNEPTIEDPSIEDPAERLRLFGQEDHVRKYGPDFVDRLKDEGFNVEKFSAADLSPEDRDLLGLNHWGGQIQACRK